MSRKPDFQTVSVNPDHCLSSHPPADPIIRQREPLNLEFPFDQLDDFLTPNHLFYIRSHFKTPQLDPSHYELKIDGAVSRPFSIRYQELRNLPSVTRPATLECAGNGRIFLSPPAPGLQWQLGARGTANWTGVPLSALLERAGLANSACEIVFEAADKGQVEEHPKPPGEIRYARSIAIEKAADALIVYRMNGEDLTPDHGFPVRVVVPGHYAMASVKWLTRISAVTQPFSGFWQTSAYAYWDELEGNPVLRALGPMALKSEIGRPRIREIIPAGQTYNVIGAAWGGHAEIEHIEFSDDDGKTWQPATFVDPPQPFVWRRWQFQWPVPRKNGACILKSRARDASGAVQPAEHDKRYGSYNVDHTIGIEVVVSSALSAAREPREDQSSSETTGRLR